LAKEESGWRKEGWQGAQAAWPRANTSLAADYDREHVIPVAEEELHVGKRDVTHGRVRVRSYIVEKPVEEQVSLHGERVEVQRRPVDRPLGAGEKAFAEKTVEAEERMEEPVVSKQARVKEELVVKKKGEDRTEKISDTLRQTKVDEDTRQRKDRK